MRLKEAPKRGVGVPRTKPKAKEGRVARRLVQNGRRNVKGDWLKKVGGKHRHKTRVKLDARGGYIKMRKGVKRKKEGRVLA